MSRLRPPTSPILGNIWWSQVAEQDGDRICRSFCVSCVDNIVSAQMVVVNGRMTRGKQQMSTPRLHSLPLPTRYTCGPYKRDVCWTCSPGTKRPCPSLRSAPARGCWRLRAGTGPSNSGTCTRASVSRYAECACRACGIVI